MLRYPVCPCAAVFLAKSAVLSSFASGRQTSLVVDAGHDATVGELFSSAGGAGSCEQGQEASLLADAGNDAAVGELSVHAFSWHRCRWVASEPAWVPMLDTLQWTVGAASPEAMVGRPALPTILGWQTGVRWE